MYRWYSSYQGDTWNLNLVRGHLSEDFKREIRSLVEQLGLKPEIGSPKSGVVDYGNIKVVIKSFTFGDFKSVIGDLHTYYTPVLKFEIVVTAKKTDPVRRGESDVELVYAGPMIVTYGEDYPRSYPFFVLPKYKTNSNASHSHHMYRGGQMCLYGEFGHSDRAWDREHDTAATAFGAAMRWIVWHERDRGQGVNADDVNNE